MRATLDRIDARNPDLNAIVSLRDRAELMSEAAKAATAPNQGWLHGMPIAIKDLSNAKGLPTSQGSPVFAGQIAQDDSIFVARLRQAGAIIIGWLEKHAEDLSHPGTVLISPADILNPPSRSTSNSINDPSDYDLVTACEQSG